MLQGDVWRHNMLGWILLAIGIAGFGLAGALDLKTTEFPDWLPYTMIAGTLAVRAVFSFLEGNIWIIGSSVIVVFVFLGFGLLLYFTRQWGDGDAWLLGALGFLFPNSAGFQPSGALPFPAVMIFNFFLIAFVYLIIYSIALGIRNPEIARKFFAGLRSNLKGIASLILAFGIACVFLVYFLNASWGIPLAAMMNLFLLPVFFAFIIIFMHYGRFMEQSFFKKQISVKDLRVGDVPVGERWRVLDKEEVKKLKKKGGKIWIKEGVRFAPVFIITLFVTLFFGNLLLLFV